MQKNILNVTIIFLFHCLIKIIIINFNGLGLMRKNVLFYDEEMNDITNDISEFDKW